MSAFPRIRFHFAVRQSKRFQREPSPLFELASVLVRFNHVAGFVVKADHCSV
jgi:hypothetical protein